MYCTCQLPLESWSWTKGTCRLESRRNAIPDPQWLNYEQHLPLVRVTWPRELVVWTSEGIQSQWMNHEQHLLLEPENLSPGTPKERHRNPNMQAWKDVNDVATQWMNSSLQSINLTGYYNALLVCPMWCFVVWYCCSVTCYRERCYCLVWIIVLTIDSRFVQGDDAFVLNSMTHVLCRSGNVNNLICWLWPQWMSNCGLLALPVFGLRHLICYFFKLQSACVFRASCRIRGDVPIQIP